MNTTRSFFIINNALIRFLLSLLFGLAAWALIIYKAFAIPITHDELSTILHYYTYNVWEIMMYPDPWPGNHILNTLLTKLSMNIFGQEQWAARLPNVLSFALYFYAAYHICLQLFKNHLIPFLGCLAFFIFNPFLLDFFSVCRGYGMSNALMVCSAMFLLKGFVTQQWRAVWWSFAFAVLASYANFTLLIYWCAASAMVAIFAWNDYLHHKNTKQFFTKIAILAGIDLIYLLLIYTPIHKMQSTDQFAYWQSNGFFRDTIISLIENSRYGSKMIDIPHEYFAIIAVLFFFIVGAFMMYYWGRHTWKEMVKTPVFIAFSLLALTVFVNIMQTIILKTPNLTTRTALSFYPLFVLLISAVLYHIQQSKNLITQIVSSLLLIFSLWHMARTVSYDRVREWWYDANTFQVLEILKNNSNNNTISLQTGWHFHRSFDFYFQTGKAPYLKLAEYNKEIESSGKYNFYYVFDSDYPALQEQYDIVEKFDGGSRLLLKRKN